jgi:hypothetical protein
MHVTMLADRTRIKRTTQTPFYGVIKEITTGITNQVFIDPENGCSVLLLIKRMPVFVGMMDLAIDRCKPGQDPEVFDLFAIEV